MTQTAAQEMKLQFVQQAYQTTAVNAVVQVFDGQPLAQSDFALASLNPALFMSPKKYSPTLLSRCSSAHSPAQA